MSKPKRPECSYVAGGYCTAPCILEGKIPSLARNVTFPATIPGSDFLLIINGYVCSATDPRKRPLCDTFSNKNVSGDKKE